MENWKLFLILNGSETPRQTFAVPSPYYEDSSILASEAGPLDIASAIGFARGAMRPSFPERQAILERAAQAFSYTQADLERSTRMTGMPVREVQAFFQQIPEMLRQPAQILAKRFRLPGGDSAPMLEALGAGSYKILLPPQGFCYVISPGNDPRASALAAANLTAFGIPFVLRASPRDPAAPLTIRALLEAGIDPRFCSLIYLDPSSPATAQKHFKLVEACQVVWTFGPAAAIDPTLRYEPRPPAARLDLEGLTGENSSEEQARAGLAAAESQEIASRFSFEERSKDHFEGRLVLRHEAGHCAAISWGSLNGEAAALLYESLAYPVVCTALKSVMALERGWADQTAELLSGLRVGDPLDPETQVGYTNPRYLDSLQALLDANRGRMKVFGGRRLSAFQAEPLLVSASQDIPDFFGQEIPAYVLAVRECRSLEEAIRNLNRPGATPRLAVSLFNPPLEQIGKTALRLSAHSVLVNQPTSVVLSALHEGNDYALLLSQTRLIRS
jgi:acyl-CoA reductase-like NAD-dependent aldehyde dehydrogenase